MYLTELAQSLKRRWYLLLAVTVLAVIATTFIVSRLPATYRANASIVLVPPETTLGDTGNPYLFLGGLEQSVDVLSRDLGSEQVREQMAQQGGSAASYTVTPDYTTSAPIVLVTTEASSAAAADAMLDAVVDQVPVSLARLQTALAVSGSAQITTQLIARSEKPETVMSGRYRAMVMVGGALMVADVLFVAMVDGLLRRRRLRAEAAADGEDEAPTGEGRLPTFWPRQRGAGPTDPPEPPSTEADAPEPASLDKRRKTGTDG